MQEAYERPTTSRDATRSGVLNESGPDYFFPAYVAALALVFRLAARALV